jgi:glycosyltransferase involved in cell wall biosynthesis
MTSPVSVIVPSHDRATLLERALSSIERQSRAPSEVIVIDDGSTDATDAMVRDRFSRARCLRQQNRGVSAARNRGIEAATGEWIALLDSDDEWLPKKLEIQLQRLAEYPELRVCHTEEIWIRDGVRVNAKQRHSKRGGWIFQDCLPLCAMSPSSILIHRGVFEQVGLFDEDLPACEDYDLWLRITARFPVLFVEQPLILKYGGHADQLSRRHWGMDRFRIRALEKVLSMPDLALADRNAAVTMLAEKSRVYAAGAGKRGRLAEAEHYRALSERYADAR